MTSLVAQTVKHLSTMWETRLRSLGREVPWRRKWQSTPVLLPGKYHGQRSLVGYSPWGRKESDVTERSSPVHRGNGLADLQYKPPTNSKFGKYGRGNSKSQ